VLKAPTGTTGPSPTALARARPAGRRPGPQVRTAHRLTSLRTTLLGLDLLNDFSRSEPQLGGQAEQRLQRSPSLTALKLANERSPASRCEPQRFLGQTLLFAERSEDPAKRLIDG